MALIQDLVLSINRVAFNIFGKDIYWYSIILVSAIITAYIMATVRGKKRGYPDDTFIDLCIIILVAGIIGARILYVLSNWSNFRYNLVSVFYIWEGGLAILGGFITALPCYVIYCVKKKINLWDLLDLIVPCFALAQCIGRWGNYVNQELYGPVVNDARFQCLPFATFIDATGSWHMATFLYESVWSLMTFIVLSVIWHRKKYKTGDVFLLYIVLYSIIRIILDAIKLDGTLQNQLICVVMIIIAAIIFFIKRKAAKDPAFEEKLGKSIKPCLRSTFVPPVKEASEEKNSGSEE